MNREIIQPTLDELVETYYEQIGKGCLHTVKLVLTGRIGEIRVSISKVSGLDEEIVIKIFAAINSISFGYKTKEEVEQKVYESLMENTHGGQSTGSWENDRKLVQMTKLARLALDANWKQKERRKLRNSS